LSDGAAIQGIPLIEYRQLAPSEEQAFSMPIRTVTSNFQMETAGEGYRHDWKVKQRGWRILNYPGSTGIIGKL